MIKKISLGLLAIILTLMVGVFLFAKDIEISVSEKEAQSKIDEYLKSSDQVHTQIRISPKFIILDFKDNNSAEVTTDSAIDGMGYEGRFVGKFSAGINYSRPKLYLSNLTLIEGGFSTDNDTESELKDLKKATLDIFRRQRDRIAKQNDKSLKEGSPEVSAELLESYVRAATQILFESIPIFDVSREGNAGWIASLALKEVRFTETAAIITLSPATALLRILGVLGVFLMIVTRYFGGSIGTFFLSRALKPENENRSD